MSGSYIIAVESGHGMNMNTLKIRPTVQAVVKFDEDGAIAWRGPTYFEGQEPRNMKASAGKQRLRWQRYYEQTGRRFEVEEREKREAKQREDKAAAEARRRVREAAPELLAALKLVMPILRGADAKCTGDTAMLATVEAALAKAEGR